MHIGRTTVKAKKDPHAEPIGKPSDNSFPRSPPKGALQIRR